MSNNSDEQLTEILLYKGVFQYNTYHVVMPIVLEVFLNMVIMWELCVSAASAILVNLLWE